MIISINKKLAPDTRMHFIHPNCWITGEGPSATGAVAAPVIAGAVAVLVIARVTMAPNAMVHTNTIIVTTL